MDDSPSLKVRRDLTLFVTGRNRSLYETPANPNYGWPADWFLAFCSGGAFSPVELGTVARFVLPLLALS